MLAAALMKHFYLFALIDVAEDTKYEWCWNECDFRLTAQNTRQKKHTLQYRSRSVFTCQCVRVKCPVFSGSVREVIWLHRIELWYIKQLGLQAKLMQVPVQGLARHRKQMKYMDKFPRNNN